MSSLTEFQTLLIYGGSFDPPHRGHVALPAAAARAVGADAVVYVPAGRAPHKLDRQQTDPRHRLAMLKIALAEADAASEAAGQPGGGVAWRILEDEVDRAADGRPSYTVDTLARLRPRFSQTARMRLLIGMDQVAIFETWKDWQRVAELAEPAVMRRPGEAEVSSLSPVWRARVVDVPEMEISSSDVRRRIAAGQPVADPVGPGVAGYIAEHGLYENSNRAAGQR